jgi:hypothetical protein
MVSKVFAAAEAKKRAAVEARKRVLPDSMMKDISSPMTRVRRGASTFLKTMVTALDLPGGKDVARDLGVAHAVHAAAHLCFPFPASALPASAGGIFAAAAAALLAKLKPAPSKKPGPGRSMLLTSDSSSGESDDDKTGDEKVGKSPAHSNNPLPGRPRPPFSWDSSITTSDRTRVR